MCGQICKMSNQKEDLEGMYVLWIRKNMTLICPEMVFDQNITPWSSMSLSLALIGKEDFGMTGAIAASSSGWEKTKFGFLVERACEEKGVFFVCLSCHHILKITLLVEKPGKQASVCAFSYSQHSSILRQISLTNQKHQSSSQKV